MSTLLVNNVKSFTRDTVTISGSNILVQGNTTLGDNINDTIVVRGHVTASGNISASGTIFADSFQSSTGGATVDFSDDVDITGSLNVSQNITAVGNINVTNITASGQLSASGITATSTVFAQLTDVEFNGTYAALSSSGLITGSDLSVSEDIFAGRFITPVPPLWIEVP